MKASTKRSIQRLYRRRVEPRLVISPELATQLCRLAQECRRQLGVLLDRRGQVDHVIIGDATKLWLPDVGRLRAGRGRMRGLRLVHTHLRQEALSPDDFTDLSLLRLDMVAAITMDKGGRPNWLHCAHLLPENVGGNLWRQLEQISVHDQELDFLELIRSLEDEFARASRVQVADQGKDRALLVHIQLTRAQPFRSEETCLAELRQLCATAGVTVLDEVIQRRARPDPRFVLGRGKVEELVQRANQLGAELLIFDLPLTPAQARAISELTELKVIDRTMLILDIFAQRARSRDGKIQVELAQLNYTMPRLVGKGTMMSRLMGGIGGRGPGETKLEVDRRRIRARISRLEAQIEQLSRRRELRRSRRQNRKLPVVSILGYTNAGKSTLLNTLTRSSVMVEDKLFATLDPKSARLRFPREREVILTDTVGFIHDLPEELFNAFRATLEEVSRADLLIHLVDLSDPDHVEQMNAVRRIVGEMGLAERPTLMVYNKVDRLGRDGVAARLASTGQGGICISATRPTSVVPLLSAMERSLWEGYTNTK